MQGRVVHFVVLVVMALAVALTTDASAQTLRVGPFQMGISPAELDAAAPGLTFKSPTSWGSTRGDGVVRVFGVDFSVSVGFYWNTGLRTVAMAHHGDEDDATCRELASASAVEFERAFGLTPPPLPEPRPLWTASVQSDEPVLADWDVSWFAARTCDCYIRIAASADPIPVPPPLLEELAEAEPIAGPPVWIAEPTREQVLAMHEARAERGSQGGTVELACRVNVEGGGLRCIVENERPYGWELGEAALGLVDLYRIAPLIAGAPTSGRKLELTIDFANVVALP